MSEERKYDQIKAIQEKFPNRRLNIETISVEDLRQDSLLFISELKQELALENKEEKSTLSQIDLSMFDSDEFQTLDERLDSEKFYTKLSKQKENMGYQFNDDYLDSYQREGKNSSLDALVKANRRLVLKIAQQYNKYLTSSLDIDDLEQFGMIGLLKAADKFDLSKEYAFSTYAIHWIRQSISRGIMDTSLTVRLPVHIFEKINKLNRLESQAMTNSGVTDITPVLKKMDMSEDQYYNLLAIRNTYFSLPSLDNPIGIDGGTTMGDMLPDSNYDIEEVIDLGFLRGDLEKSMTCLKEKERKILYLRFGFDGENCKTLEEIGNIFGVTRERIRQIEAKAIRKMKKKVNRELISDYYYTNGRDNVIDDDLS